MDQQHVKTTWASAFCIAQYPDPYVMWALSDEVQGDHTLQEFHLPEGHSVIVDVVPFGWAESRIIENQKNVYKSGKNKGNAKVPLSPLWSATMRCSAP